MDAHKLVEVTKAEIVRGHALARVDGKRMRIASYIDGNLVLTEDGRELVAKLDAAKPKAKPARADDADS